MHVFFWVCFNIFASQNEKWGKVIIRMSSLAILVN